jgi:hypothetical protein
LREKDASCDLKPPQIRLWFLSRSLFEY